MDGPADRAGQRRPGPRPRASRFADRGRERARPGRRTLTGNNLLRVSKEEHDPRLKAGLEVLLVRAAVAHIEAGAREDTTLVFDRSMVSELLAAAEVRACDFRRTTPVGPVCTRTFTNPYIVPNFVANSERVEPPSPLATTTTPRRRSASTCSVPRQPNPMLFAHAPSSPRDGATGCCISSAISDCRALVSPHLCHVGDDGHACAEVRVPEVASSIDTLTDPNAALDEVDRLNQVVATRQTPRRLFDPTQLATLAALSNDCSTPTDFMSQLSTIASLLGSIAIQDDEIDADELAELQSGDRNRPLNRLEAALKHELGDADLDLATQAIATLRAVNAVRNSLQHPESRGGLLQVGRSGRAVSDVAAELGASWHAINDAVIAYGSALLDADSHPCRRRRSTRRR